MNFPSSNGFEIRKPLFRMPTHVDVGEFGIASSRGSFGDATTCRARAASSAGGKVFLGCKIIVPLIPKDMFRLVCLVKLVFFAREGVAF